MKIKSSFIILLIISSKLLYAQAPLLDSAKNELIRINQMLDSTRMLAFDVHFTLETDTVVGQFHNNRQSASFILNAGKSVSEYEGMKMIQTDSFSYTLEVENDMMMMVKERKSNRKLFPIADFLDSILVNYGTNYSVVIDSVFEDTAYSHKRVSFLSTNDELPYKTFVVEYEAFDYLPIQISFTYFQPQPPLDSLTENVIAYNYNVKCAVIFENYKAANDLQIFNDNQYVLYNRQRKIYEPAPKYRNYRFMTSGFTNEDPEAIYYK